MTETTPGDGPAAYRLRVDLDVEGPPVWREVLELPDATIPQLHRTLQAVFEWEGRHRWAVEAAGRRIERPRQAPTSGPGSGDDPERAISQLLAEPGDAFRYVYDLGSQWGHEVTLEEFLDRRPHRVLPVCVGGSGAGPLEDSRGVGDLGYLPAHADPEHFDVERADARLERERRARAGPFAEEPPPTVDEVMERVETMGLAEDELEEMRADLEEQERRWTG